MNKNVIIIKLIILVFIATCNNPINEISNQTNLSDYFPLKIGNKWYYSYRYGTGNSQYGISKNGILIWEVVGNTQLDKEKSEFKIQSFYTGCEIRHTSDYTKQPPDHYDTTYQSNLEGFFTIISTKDTLSMRRDSGSTQYPFIDFFPFGRYNNYSIVGDTLMMKIPADWSGYQKIKVNTGLVKYQTSNGHVGNYVSTNLTLDSLHLK